MAWTDLCKFTDLKDGEGLFVKLADRNIAVFMKDGVIHALDDRCPHAGASLAGGYLDEGNVVCPWHQWTFSLEDGQLVGGGRARIRIYSSRIIGQGDTAIVQADISGPPLTPRE